MMAESKRFGVTRRLALVASLCLILCGAPLFAHAVSGSDIAYLVNQRYHSTVKQCAVGRAAWQCSGVLLRAPPPGSANNFASLTEQERLLASAQVTYFREDLSTSALPSTVGVILPDGFTAAGWERPITLRCAYPFAPVLTSGLSANGCDLVNAVTAQMHDADGATCPSVGVEDTPGWLSHFSAHQQDIQRQCSLSGNPAAPFNVMLEAHEAVSPELAKTATALLIAAWDPSDRASMPVQAFFYDISTSGQLLQAQRYQKQYFDATGQWIPVLRVGFDDAGKVAFGFDATDQLDYGFDVAANLNDRFANTADCPNNAAAYMCNGVVLRITGYSTAYRAWNPSPNAIKLYGVAFHYLRIDANVADLIDFQEGGLIMDALGSPSQMRLTVRCIYPSDAGTDLRNERCGTYQTPSSGPCAAQGISTLAQWQAHYRANGWQKQCSLGADKAAFDLSIAARRTLPPVPQPILHERWNELVIAPWPQNVPLQIPLQAAFYRSGMPTARAIQADYFGQTARFLPVIRVDIRGNPQRPFSYLINDQTAAQ